MYRTMHSLSSMILLPAILSIMIPGHCLAATLQVKVADDDLTLVSAPGKASYVIRGDGSRVILPLPKTALVHTLEAAAESWFAAGVDVAPAGRRLVVLKGAGSKVKELPAPVVQASKQLREPTVLMGKAGFVGLAWIEGRGSRLQAVRAARWTVGGWREAVTVSPPGPGSQMALTSAFLGDGSWMLAWAAFDGEDDEIFWSRFDGSHATKPERLGLDNSVPDITPCLWASQAGVLAAWSRYDGNDYRLHLARFTGLSWSSPEMVGPKGSLYPTFHAGQQGSMLLYMTAAPRAWVVAELDDQGHARRQMTFETFHSERPLLRSLGDSLTGGDVSMVWGGEESEPEVVSGLVWKPIQK